MRWWLAGAWVIAALAGCDGDPDCVDHAEALRSLLASAEPGGVVCLGAAEVSGPFEVPAGVTLRGAGREASVIAAPYDGIGVVLRTGEGIARLRGLTIGANGLAGVVVTGPGAADLRDLEVLVSRGIGIGVESTGAVAISDVSLLGPVTVDNAELRPPDPVPERDATHGVVLVESPEVALREVSTRGFALFGLLAVDSGVTWEGGDTDGNLGTGWMIYGGTATVRRVRSCEILRGLRLIPSYGAVVAGGAAVETEDLLICDGYVGLLQSSASGSHRRLVVRGNLTAGAWVQLSSAVEIVGADITDNYYAGVVVLDSSDVTVGASRIEATRLARRLGEGAVGTVDIGDGVRILGRVADVALRDLTLSANERTGCFVDEESLGGLSFDGVVVEGTGDELGCITSCWTAVVDPGVERRGATVENDAALPGTAGCTRPPALPPLPPPEAPRIELPGL